MKKNLILLIIVLLQFNATAQKDKVVIKGVVRSRILATDDDNAIPGVVIKDENGKSIGKTNTYGEFEIKYSKALIDNKTKFTFNKKEFLSKEVEVVDQSDLIVHLDCEDDKYLREVVMTVVDEDKKLLKDAVITHSFYHKESKTDYNGEYILRVPNPAFLDSWEHKDETQKIIVSISKKGYLNQEFITSYPELKKPITINLKSLKKIELVFKNEKNEIEKHRFVNLESLKDYVVSIKDKNPLLAQLIQNKIDLDPNLLIFDMLEDQKNVYIIEIEDENGVKKKHKFVNLDAIEDYILELRKTNPELADKLKALLLSDPDLHVFDLTTPEVFKEELIEDKVIEVVKVQEEKVNKFLKGQLISTILHDYDDASQNASSKTKIDNIVSLMKNNPSMIISVESHTDSKGEDDYNMSLSKKRAKFIKNYLVNNGVSKKRIEIVYLGESKPLVKNENEDGSDNPIGRAKNRRTEFKVVSNILE